MSGPEGWVAGEVHRLRGRGLAGLGLGAAGTQATSPSSPGLATRRGLAQVGGVTRGVGHITAKQANLYFLEV